MPKKNPEVTKLVSKLRGSIEKLTGREPESDDPRYLAQRLADLKARKSAGESVRYHTGEPQSIMSISMPVSAREAIGRILEKEKAGQSELARKAFALWAMENGYAAEAAAIGGD